MEILSINEKCHAVTIRWKCGHTNIINKNQLQLFEKINCQICEGKMKNETFFAIYLNDDDQLEIVEISTLCDERFKKERFVCERNSKTELTFSTEQKASTYLNDFFHADFIDQKNRRGESLWGHMRKDI